MDKNTAVTKPQTPEKAGFTFHGWYTDQACTEAYDFNTKVTKDFTLYAGWTKDQQTLTFSDVNENDWFYDAVLYASANGLFFGITEDRFAPDTAVSRGMMVTALYRAEGEPQISGESRFADVSANQYYTSAVIWAETNGIVKGYSDTEFAPDKLISREEAAAIMKRYASYKGTGADAKADLTKFSDEKQIADWARSSLEWAVGYGLITGKENGVIDPQSNITRAEAAALLQRYFVK